MISHIAFNKFGELLYLKPDGNLYFFDLFELKEHQLGGYINSDPFLTYKEFGIFRIDWVDELERQNIVAINGKGIAFAPHPKNMNGDVTRCNTITT